MISERAKQTSGYRSAALFDCALACVGMALKLVRPGSVIQ